LENQLTKENAPRIKAKIIGEGANGPTTPEAERVFEEKGILVIPDTYLNAGGVTVSYFEWLKNLQHVRMGRMAKRFEEDSATRLLCMIEQKTKIQLTPEERRMVVKGADEIDLVNSGLEDTMILAYNEIREIKKRTGCSNLRTAALISAIDKIAVSYLQLGIFP
jgi:glutamate dehydrogenase (NAD(P)+)